MKVLLTGGAEGADMLFEELAEKSGHNIRAYSFQGHTTKSKYRIILSVEQLRDVMKMVEKASFTIHRPIPRSKPYIVNLLARNAYQIIETNCVYAVSTIDFVTKTVNGGTGWAIEMAKHLSKPIYVFDQDQNSWFHWSSSDWVKVDNPPTLTSVFTGIGSRSLNDNGRKAIASLF
jgi:hypothetical protein